MRPMPMDSSVQPGRGDEGDSLRCARYFLNGSNSIFRTISVVAFAIVKTARVFDGVLIFFEWQRP
jgi:hypothetical protein